MRRYLLSLVAILGVLAASPSAARAGVVYVSRPFDAFGTVDLSTGLYTSIGTTTVQLDALALAPGGTLYGVGSDNVLYQVNKATAALTEVGPTGTSFGVVGLAARSDGALFGTDAFTNGPGGFEYRINPATGMATNLGQSGLSSGFAPDGGLAFGPANTLYLDYGLSDSDYALYTVNQGTGKAAKVGNAGVSTSGLVFSGGQMYGFDFFGDIYQFNLTTGAASLTGKVTGGFGEIDAAAAAEEASSGSTPEPASLTPLAVAAAGLAAYRCRRRTRAAA